MRPTSLLLALALAAPAVALATPIAPTADPACDLLITNGRVVDGTGAPWFRADVCVADGRINAIQSPGKLAKREAKRRIDATNLVVAPGFIDLLGQSEYSV
ncbi:MAG: hypothetical protein KBI44_00715, partial [Thermoanaerobaculia bacterium]|nr:hypothetical protein [Thermoanaerobaculia bacterium]